MRRKELESRDPDLFREVAADCSVGYLGLVTADGRPRSVALDFAAVGEVIVFHGALDGQKAGLIGAGTPAEFTMVKEFSFIPSHFTAPAFACPATHFFKCVEIVGRCEPVPDPADKAEALQALMQKYQPEGGHDALDPEVPGYRRALAKVGVFRIVPESWTAKRKFGQNEPEPVRRAIIEGLLRRGGPLDAGTVLEMRRDLDGDHPA